MSSVLVNRRKCGHRDTDKNPCDGTEARRPVKTEAQTELGYHQPRKPGALGARRGEKHSPHESWENVWHCSHFGFKHVTSRTSFTSRTSRQYISVVLRHPVLDNLLRQPSGTNAPCTLTMINTTKQRKIEPDKDEGVGEARMSSNIGQGSEWDSL